MLEPVESLWSQMKTVQRLFTKKMNLILEYFINEFLYFTFKYLFFNKKILFAEKLQNMCKYSKINNFSLTGGQGSFLVRPSENSPGNYSLFVLCDKIVQRFRIEKHGGQLLMGGRYFDRFVPSVLLGELTD